jgi:hypothetical protein
MMIKNGKDDASMKPAHISALLLIIASICLCFPPAQAKDMNAYSIGGVTFQSPLPFSPPSKVGLDASSLIYPASSSAGRGECELTFVSISKKMQDEMKCTDREMLDYVKSTFLAISGKAKAHRKRSFIGKTVTGDVLECSIPVKSHIEVYLIPLSRGNKLAVSFKYTDKIASVDVEKVINTVASTMKEK